MHLLSRIALATLACGLAPASDAAPQTTEPLAVRGEQKISNASPSFPDSLDDLDAFGGALGALGDLDGDGIPDLAAGAVGDDAGGTDRGAVWILFGNPDGTLKATQRISSIEGGLRGSLQDRDSFGSAVVSVGDLDGDGVVDLAVGANRDEAQGLSNQDEGGIWILFLNPDGTVRTQQQIINLEGGFQGVLDDQDSFGSSLAALGDLDGDGTADLAVGAPGDDDALPVGSTGRDRGAVWILFLNPDGTVKDERKLSQLTGIAGSLTLTDDDRFGGALASPGDLDGDGVVELAVGASGDDDTFPISSGGDDRGAVWILFLNPDGTASRKKKISDLQGGLSGSLRDNDFFGSSLAAAGDLDGNGIGDLWVGASGDDDAGSGVGALWLLRLEADGTVKSESKLSDPSLVGLGRSVAVQGDLDGDGLADLACGLLGNDLRGAFSVLFLGAGGSVLATQEVNENAGGLGPNTLDRADLFGSSVTLLGDLDGDGVEDLAVGTPDDDDGIIDMGAVWILLLDADGSPRAERKISATTGGWTAPLSFQAHFGTSVAGIGDLDRDGVTDLAVGAPYDDDGGPDTGAVWILFLNADGSVRAQQKISALAGGFQGELQDRGSFGGALACPGDLDGDGVTDLVVGEPYEDDGDDLGQGAIWLVFLNADGTVKGQRKITEETNGFQGPLGYGHAFGTSVAALGDLDGNGVGDLAVGATGDDFAGRTGSVWILLLTHDATVVGEQKIGAGSGGLKGPLRFGDAFGSALACPGDLDHDGVPDLAVGASGDDDGGPVGMGTTEHGAVWVLLLTPGGRVKREWKISATRGGFRGPLQGDRFGSALVSLGDRNADGIGDLGVGAPRDDDGGIDHGAVWILLLQVPGRSTRQAGGLVPVGAEGSR